MFILWFLISSVFAHEALIWGGEGACGEECVQAAVHVAQRNDPDGVDHDFAASMIKLGSQKLNPKEASRYGRICPP
jgi:hypothetical protein